MDMRTRYVVKGIGKEQTIDSKINIFYDKATGKITKLEDKWDGKLPDSSFTNVSIDQLFNPWWYLHYAEGWAWWTWSFTWEMWWWQVCALLGSKCDLICEKSSESMLTFSSLQALRKLNAVSVPKIVGVPKNDEQDAAKGNQ